MLFIFGTTFPMVFELTSDYTVAGETPSAFNCCWTSKYLVLRSFIAGLSKKILGILEPNVVESYAAKHAIQLLHDLGFNKIVLEGDSQKVIKMLDCLEFDDSLPYVKISCAGKFHRFLGHLMFLLITWLSMPLIF